MAAKSPVISHITITKCLWLLQQRPLTHSRSSSNGGRGSSVDVTYSIVGWQGAWDRAIAVVMAGAACQFKMLCLVLLSYQFKRVWFMLVCKDAACREHVAAAHVAVGLLHPAVVYAHPY
jgi:hypothetical protein